MHQNKNKFTTRILLRITLPNTNKQRLKIKNNSGTARTYRLRDGKYTRPRQVCTVLRGRKVGAPETLRATKKGPVGRTVNGNWHRFCE